VHGPWENSGDRAQTWGDGCISGGQKDIDATLALWLVGIAAVIIANETGLCPAPTGKAHPGTFSEPLR